MTPFDGFELRNAMLFDYSDNTFPTRLHGWIGCNRFETQGSTFYGFVLERTIVETDMGEFMLEAGMYFCASAWVYLRGGRGIVIERLAHRGMPMLGGPIEASGRLKYIDGCTDSLLIPPVKLGDPCLNALYFPAEIDQTEHTHPSMRVGVVVSGRGECVTPEGIIPLVPGMVFIIHEEGLHKFRTLGTQGMVVIAYHPDSDFGPQDEEHPMINRTIVGGVSAREIDAIRTK